MKLLDKLKPGPRGTSALFDALRRAQAGREAERRAERVIAPVTETAAAPVAEAQANENARDCDRLPRTIATDSVNRNRRSDRREKDEFKAFRREQSGNQ